MENEQFYDLKVENLSLSFFGGYDVIGNVNLAIKGKYTLCIYGGHNQGKTSLLRALAGLEQYSGSIKLCGRELKEIDESERKIAYSFDLKSLNEKQSVFKNIVYPLVLRKCEDSYIASRLAYCAKLFDVYDLLNVKVKELTELQKCRVLMARIFVRDCKLYLLDNIFGKLDYYYRKVMFSLLTKAVNNSNAVVIYATDRLMEASIIGDKTAIIENGSIEQIDDYFNLYHNPQSLAVIRALDEKIGVINGYLKSENGQYYIKIDENRIKCLAPIADIYLNKLVACCVYPEDVNAEKCEDGDWSVESVMSCKDGYYLTLVKDESILYCKNNGLKRGDTVKVSINATGNYFDLISEKIICKKD